MWIKALVFQLFLLFFLISLNEISVAESPTPEAALAEVTQFGKQIQVDHIRLAATTQNGRIKPFDTLTRETILFLTGSYKKWDLDSNQLYLTLSSLESAALAPIIEIRHVELRKRLGFTADKRYFSLADLESSPLLNLAMPLLQKEQEGQKLNEDEKKTTEVFSQMNLFKQIATQEHFLKSLEFSWLETGEVKESSPVLENSKQYLTLLKNKQFSEAYQLSPALKTLTRHQPAPDLLKHALTKLDVEVFFFDWRPFLWASLIGILCGLALIVDATRKKLSLPMIYSMFGLFLTPIIIGLGLRVYITQFAPITNMYGTMIWVAFGVSLFSFILYALYRNTIMCGFMFLVSGIILMLTENIPLILSPDLDPIVAVLRSNFWLSTHVTTITISYAAFTIAMVLGNIILIKEIFGQNKPKQIQDFFHYSYRMVQLGCFLLTVGIILGGVWADYSWGRFWGWDPKETWALIADLGFLVLLHARFVGWVTPFTFLAFLPVSYLLVVMAWYGVNFILAAGLHSYGFSRGGAKAVGLFVGAQLLIVLIASAKFMRLKTPAKK